MEPKEVEALLFETTKKAGILSRAKLQADIRARGLTALGVDVIL